MIMMTDRKMRAEHEPKWIDQNGKKPRQFHSLISKFLEQHEEDRQRPAPVMVRARERPGSNKYIDVTKEDTDQLLNAFLALKQGQQPLPGDVPNPVLTPPPSPKKKKKASGYTRWTPEEKKKYMTRAKKLANANTKKHLQQQQQTGSGISRLSNRTQYHPRHFTSLFTGRHTVLM